MKKVISVFTCYLVVFNAYAIEKDRGGEVVPSAKGPSSVTLSRNYSQSIVIIGGEAAKLLFNSLRTEVRENDDVFAKRGEDLLKEKDNVKCVSGSTAPSTYKCLIRIDN
jgi:hypothetical protein